MSNLTYNSIFSTLEPSASIKLGLNQSNKGLLNLSVGAPSVSPPTWIEETLRACRSISYQPSRGTLTARKRVVDVIQCSELNRFCPETQVILVPGAKTGIFLALKTLCSVGDRVTLLEPYWLSFPQICRALELKVSTCVPFSLDGFSPSFDLGRVLDSIRSNKPKALIINSPNNPMGFVHSEEDIISIAMELEKINGWLILDEVYKDLAFSNCDKAPFDTILSNVVRVGSFSKSLSVPGLRAGYVFAAKDCVDRIELLIQHLLTCLPSTSTFFIESLCPDKCRECFEETRRVYQENSETFSELLKEYKVSFYQPQSSFNVMVNFSKWMGDGDQCADNLKNVHSVLVTPGRHYGMAYKNFIRVSLVAPPNVVESKFREILSSLK